MTITATDIVDLLRARYPAPKFAFITEVPNGTSHYKSRTCDAMAMGCWSTAGIELHGFEIKISRSDWTRELQDLGKAEAFVRHCHRWWIAAPKGIVKLEEMPAEWGLLEVSGAVMRVKKGPSRLNPETVTWQFLAGLLRRAVTSTLDDQKLTVQYNLGFEAGRISGAREHDRDLERANQEIRRLREAIAEFEQASGVRIDMWDCIKVGDAVRQCLAMRDNLGTIKLASGACDRLSAAMKSLIVELQALGGE